MRPPEGLPNLRAQSDLCRETSPFASSGPAMSRPWPSMTIVFIPSEGAPQDEQVLRAVRCGP